eukprot:g2133.t1
MLFTLCKVAIVTGSSRGIGRECVLALARLGCNVVVAAKTVTPHPTLPGTIYTVAKEAEALGVRALALQVDIRDEKAIERMVSAVISEFGRIDILVNNASALWWQDISDTPVKKYDLINQINARGTFVTTKFCLPHMAKNGFGRVITMSPPISTGGIAGHTAYLISKYGMTLTALGVAQEYENTGITAHSLWPATIIESLASKNFQLGDRSMWRKATILSDCVIGLVCDPDPSYTGKMLIDDEYLRHRQGFTDKDFVQYRCDPDVEPGRFLAQSHEGGFRVRRGDVRKLEKDIQNDVVGHQSRLVRSCLFEPRKDYLSACPMHPSAMGMTAAQQQKMIQQQMIHQAHLAALAQQRQSHASAPTVAGPSSMERSVFMPGLDPDMRYADVLNLANMYGHVLSAKIVKKAASAGRSERIDGFVNFVNATAAKSFCNASRSRSVTYVRRRDGQRISVAVLPAKPRKIEDDVATAIRGSNATRNLMVTGFGSSVDEASIRSAFHPHVDGFESIVLDKTKGHAFVNTVSIRGAMRAMQNLNGMPIQNAHGRKWTVTFAKEKVYSQDKMPTGPVQGMHVQKRPIDMLALATRRERIPPTRAANGAVATSAELNVASIGFVTPTMCPIDNSEPLRVMSDADRTVFPMSMNVVSGAPSINVDGVPCRSIFIGMIPPAVTFHDICRLGNAFGPIEWIKFLPQKQCAFLNFVYQQHAAMLFAVASRAGIMLYNCTLQFGWAKSQALSLELAGRIKSGATRILFLGNLSSDISERTIAALFWQTTLGLPDRHIESIVINRKHHFAFLATTSLAAAVRMHDRLKNNLVLDGLDVDVAFAAERVRKCEALVEAVKNAPMPTAPMLLQQQQHNMAMMYQQRMRQQQLAHAGTGSNTMAVGRRRDPRLSRDPRKRS